MPLTGNKYAAMLKPLIFTFVQKIRFSFLLIVLIVELVIGLAIFFAYPILSMLFFGEGSDSLLYSDFNSFLWFFCPYLILLFNISRFLSSKRNENTLRQTTYLLISSLYVIFITGFLIYWGFRYNFDI